MSQLADAVVMVNDSIVQLVPDSLEMDEGLGEQKALPQSEGGGKVTQLFSNDLTTNFATISWQMRTTVDHVEQILEWKQNANRNVVNIAAEDSDGKDLTRVFTQALLGGNYKIQIQSEGVVDIEFMANAPI